MIIDTHCHLDDDRYLNDLEDVLDKAKEAGIGKFIIPGADPNTIDRAIYISEKYDNIWFAVGVHPYEIDKYSENFIRKYITHKKCIAVGECGLDYYRLPKDNIEKEETIKLQKKVFISQIELAKEYKKPLIIHIREASIDSMDLLNRYAGEEAGVLHCFNANQELLKLAEKGFYYGIGGVITFKNARKLVEIFHKIPKDKLLIETDSPYLTPHPFRGKRNEPSYCKFVLEKMVELSEISKNEMEQICQENTKKLFGI